MSSTGEDDDASWSNLSNHEFDRSLFYDQNDETETSLNEAEKTFSNLPKNEEGGLKNEELEEEERARKEKEEEIEAAWGDDDDDDVRQWLAAAEGQFVDSPLNRTVSEKKYQNRGARDITKDEENNDDASPVSKTTTPMKTSEAMKKLKRSLDVKILMSVSISVVLGIVALCVFLLTEKGPSSKKDELLENFSFSSPRAVTIERALQMDWEERMDIIEEISRLEKKLRTAKEHVEELVEKILNEERKIYDEQERNEQQQHQNVSRAIVDEEQSLLISTSVIIICAVLLTRQFFLAMENCFGNTTNDAASQSQTKDIDWQTAVSSQNTNLENKVAQKTMTTALSKVPFQLVRKPPPPPPPPRTSGGKFQIVQSSSPNEAKNKPSPPRPSTSADFNFQRSITRADSTNEFGRKMQDVANDCLSMQLYGND